MPSDTTEATGADREAAVRALGHDPTSYAPARFIYGGMTYVALGVSVADVDAALRDFDAAAGDPAPTPRPPRV